MRLFMRAIVLILIVGVLVSATMGYLYLRKELSVPYPTQASPNIVEIPKGMHNRDIVHLLHERNVLANEYAALVYIAVSGNRGNLRAGEYLFDMSMTIPDVIDKLVSGAVYLHKFTVPEGLTTEETAKKWQEQGFGTEAEFLAAARESSTLIHDFDASAQSLEGYLFPETYSFPARTTAQEAVAAMVGRFKNVVGKLQQSAPAEQWPQALRETVILASIIEAEAAIEDERPVIASVYLNRLGKNILLQCDPTTIYALKIDGKYKGRLTAADLKYDSRYNTYVYPGLPPGPIMNPGYASLEAAIKPSSTNFIFFVRTEGGRHTFSDNLAAHNRAVRQYRALRRSN